MGVLDGESLELGETLELAVEEPERDGDPELDTQKVFVTEDVGERVKSLADGVKVGRADIENVGDELLLAVPVEDTVEQGLSRAEFVFDGSALRDMDADELDEAVLEPLLDEDPVLRAEMVSDGDADMDRSVCVADPLNKFAEIVSVTVAGMNCVMLAYGDCDSIDDRVLLAEAHGDDE